MSHPIEALTEVELVWQGGWREIVKKLRPSLVSTDVANRAMVQNGPLSTYLS